MKALTPKQQAFVERYLVGFNGAEAARLAGYSAHTAREQAARLLSNVHIKAHIAARIAELKATTDEVLLRLASHSRASMADFLKRVPVPSTVDSDAWELVLDLDKAQRMGKLHLLKKYKDGPEGVSVELHDAQAATVQLAKIHGLFVERVEVRTWRDRVIDLLKAERVTPAEVVAEFGPSLARELFAAAGVVVSDDAG